MLKAKMTIREAYEACGMRLLDHFKSPTFPQPDDMTRAEYNVARARWLSEELGTQVVVL